MESIDKKLEKNINIDNIYINEKNRYIDNNRFNSYAFLVYNSTNTSLITSINNISENITKKKSKQNIYKFEDYFIFWN